MQVVYFEAAREEVGSEAGKGSGGQPVQGRVLCGHPPAIPSLTGGGCTHGVSPQL